MTIKNILVSFNGSNSAQAALKTAIILAERYSAHVTGILAHGLPNMLYAYGGHVPQIAMDQLEAADKLHREQVKESFAEHSKGYPSERVHYLDVYGEADETLMEVALGYDLVIVGAADKRSDFPHMDIHPDVVARHSGRPVLVVPGGYAPDGFNESLLLAWDGKRAAARALADVMSLFKPTAKTAVLCIGPDKRTKERAMPAMQQLERHGFAPKLIRKKAKKIAKAILATADEESAGLLAMGAYEHAKLAEDLFGGVTNSVLKKARIPVLLSH